MKRKAIEQIPPVPAGKEETDRPYRAAAAVMKIGGQNHLITDIYLTSQPETPVIRIVMNKTEYQNYRFQTSTWDRKKLNMFQIPGQMRHITEINMFIGTEDTKIIRAFTKKIPEFYQESGFTRIRKCQDYIDQERSDQRTRREKEKLETRIRNTPKLPGELDSWFREEFSSCLFYKRNRYRAEIYCSGCGNRYTIRFKETTGSIEEQAEPWGTVPEHNQYGTCKSCRTIGIYKAKGRQQEVRKVQQFYLVQRYAEGDQSGIVVRYLTGCHTARPDQKETFEFMELERAYFIQGVRKVQIDYRKHSNWSGRDFWDYKNFIGLHTAVREKGLYVNRTQPLTGTEFAYTGIMEYIRKEGRVDLINYFMAYRKMPELELAVKLKLWNLAERIVDTRGVLGEELKLEAKTPWEKLKIRKQDLQYLVQKEGAIQALKILQFEKKTGCRLSDIQRDFLQTFQFRANKMERILPYMSMTKFLNRIQNYAGVDMTRENSMCSHARRRLGEIAGRYTDYLIMRLDLGYDLYNTVYQYPRQLEEAHRKMVLEQNKEQNEKRIRAMREKYPEIERKYKKYRIKYRYETEELLIRPAESAAEIITEGQLLHHCVGNETYIKEHNDGKHLILFLRKKELPDIPYITIEISVKTGKIKQWYGANDRKPDEAHIAAVLKEFEDRLTGKESKPQTEAAG